MARYKAHCALNLGLFLPGILLGAFTFAKEYPLNIPALASAFVVTTFFFSPDLDLAHQIKFFSWRGLFSLPFRLYPKFFRHRGLSHVLILGTLSRIIWLAILFLLLFFVFTRTLPNWNLLHKFAVEHRVLLFSLFIGVCLADFSHILVDIISSKMK